MLLVAIVLLQLESPDDWRVGARWHIGTSFGEPTNDIIGGALYGSRRLADDWWLTAELYHASGDFENPGDAVLGTRGTPTADAKITLTMLTATVEWHPFDLGDRFDVYVGAGLGVALAGDAETEKSTGIDVEVDGKFGFQAHVKAGGAVRLFGGVYFTLEAHFTEVFAKLEVKDRVSGDSGAINRWDVAGFAAGFEVRF